MGIARDWAESELGRLQPLGLRRHLEPLEGPQGPVVRIAGHELINFSSNDYLGLASDPRLAKAASVALDEDGTGSGASRLVVGDLRAHRALEETLARFEKSESALLFNAGYAANVGVVSSLVGKDDVVFSDALNHASLVDGCRLSRSEVVIYPHLDVGALAERLRAVSGRRRKLVVTDAVFSMDGDCAPMAELAELCRAEGAALMVDEAHATGVLGPTGAGLCEAAGVADTVDVRMGTLGKALGVFGAYVACDAPVRELLFNKARSLVYSTALPPMVCRAAKAAVEVVMEEPGLRERLWRNIRHFTEGLRALGMAAEARSAIFPIVLGEPSRALEAAAFLRARGVLAKPIRPPSVPKGTSRLRFALSAAHEISQLDLALEALEAGGFARGGGAHAG